MKYPMLVVVIQNEFNNETIGLVNEKKLSHNWVKFRSWKVHCK